MENEGQDPLFPEFNAATREAWRAAAEALLKGASFEKKLLTPTPEGITLQPLYFREDAEKVPHLEGFPGLPGFARGYDAAGVKAAPWDIAQELPEGMPEAFNQQVLAALMRGQTAVRLLFDQPTQAGRDPGEDVSGTVGVGGTSVFSAEDMGQAVQAIVPEAVRVSMKSGASALPLTALLAAALQDAGRSPSELRGCLGADPLGVLAKTGSLPRPLEVLYDEIAALVVATQGAEDLRVLCVSGLDVANAGASAVEELACCLATGLAYLRALTARGVSVDEAVLAVEWEMSLGPSFFMEIAKLRAARLLWARMASALGATAERCGLRLSVKTGQFNKSTLDPYVNMLRTTTEALSGAVAGVQSMTVSPFDEGIRTPGEFSRRIARNTQIILQEECNLLDVIDPAGGSWFLEKLTDELAGRAWTLFQDIEREGGMEAALIAGFIQNKVAVTAASRKEQFASRRSTLIGVNLYPNTAEQPLPSEKPGKTPAGQKRMAALAAHKQARASGWQSQLENLSAARTMGGESLLQAAMEAARAGATLGEISQALGRELSGDIVTVSPWPEERASLMFERLRAASSAYAKKHGHPPRIHLTTLGALRKHKVRMDFTSGFFEVGGFDLRAAKGADDVETAVQACLDSGALLTVICGIDDDYPAFVPVFCKALKSRRPDIQILLAGHPGDHEAAWREAGMDDFLYFKSHLLDMNTRYLKVLGAL